MESAIAEQVPEAPETYNKASGALVAANHWQIVSNDGFVQAGEFRDSLKAIETEINATFDGPISAAFKAHKTIVAAKKNYSEPLELALKVIKQKMIAWAAEMDRINRLEQARRELEAKRKAEEDALELAATLEAAGACEAAAQVLDEPIAPAPVILPKATPAIKGFSSRRIYDAAVIDRKAFLLAIVAGKIPDSAWEPNQQFLRQQAGALKEAMAWPGVKLVWKDV